MKAPHSTMALLILLLAVCAGCGGDDDDDGNPTGPSIPALPFELSTDPGDQPVWADAQHVVSKWGSNWTIHSLDSSGSSVFLDIDTQDYIQSYDVSPDQVTLAYSTRRGQWYDLVLHDRQDQTEVTVRESGVNRSYYTPRWSPDGDRIICNGGGKLLLATRTKGWRVTTLREGGTVPNWSPDGQRIVYLGEDSEVWIIGVDGTGDTRLTNDGDSKGPVAWSPDGSRIAVVVGDSPDYLRVISATSGETLFEIHDEVADLRWPSWSPDGSMLACSRKVGGAQATIWIHAAE